MSKDWVKDINEMQSKYKTHDWIENADINQLKAFLRFLQALLCCSKVFL